MLTWVNRKLQDNNIIISLKLLMNSRIRICSGNAASAKSKYNNSNVFCNSLSKQKSLWSISPTFYARLFWRNFFAQLVCTYIISFLVQKLLLKCWWNWHQLMLQITNIVFIKFNVFIFFANYFLGQKNSYLAVFFRWGFLSIHMGDGGTSFS